MNRFSIYKAIDTHYPEIKHLLDLCKLPSDDIEDTGSHTFLIMSDGSHIVGTIAMKDYHPVGLLRSLAVEKNYRGQGYGSALVQQLESEARTQGIETLYLLTETADAFFQSLGYLVTQRDKVPAAIQETSEFSNICPDSAVCLMKSL